MNINRQKLIEDIENVSLDVELWTSMKPHEIVQATAQAYMDFVMETINSQPPADQWIPCSSGTLPAHGRTVPVTNEVSQGKRYMTTATYYTKKGVVDDYEWTGEGFYQYDSEYGYGRLHNVVAWLNVEPYKEE